ncbi:hypothetical protein, conserved [Babesia bigemina]|uniref:AP2/ERF domain-containing protein n=1 Tax=Babesia bigemina TaxID=5866 RepID=A0A061DA64_BABBI|nr:hypothetical protein, conserved [Babesia bigemina]CDR97428.1 hypothetical protein, conserved [Babesia bigemina]|eukprot:XP_012769614.1 hypothetical protein, conserved [Babesia bigemina]
MSHNSSGLNPYGSYGDMAPSLPLEKCAGAEGSLGTKEGESLSFEPYDETTTQRSTSLVDDSFGNVESYPSDANYYGDRTGCRSSFTDGFADVDTVDMAIETNLFADTEYPGDCLDHYVNTYGNGRCVGSTCGFRGFTPISEEGSVDAVHPSIRPLSTPEASSIMDDFSRYGLTPRFRQVDTPCQPFTRQGTFIEPNHHLENFVRATSQLCQSMESSFTRPSSECTRSDFSGFGIGGMRVTTPPAGSSLEQRGTSPADSSLPTQYFQSSDAQAYDSELFFTPTLSNKDTRMCNNYSVASNYCVYVGSDSNVQTCGCNMSRPCGGNCHVSGCPLVTSELEPSTEHWPVSGSSHLQSLVRRLDCVVESYKTVPRACADSTNFRRLKSRSVQHHNKGGFSSARESISSNSGEFVKRSSSIPAEFSERREESPSSEYYVQTSYEDSPYNNDMLGEVDPPAKHKKTSSIPAGDSAAEIEMPSRNEYGRFVPSRTTSVDSGTDGRPHHTTPKSSKKKSNPAANHTGEKVSGVWYDTNRHLWRVVYMKGNKRKTQGFSSIKLGYEEARRKAIAMRHEMVAMRRPDKI